LLYIARISNNNNNNNNNISNNNNNSSREYRESLNLQLQRERIFNLRIDSVTNVFKCVGIIAVCGFISYFVLTGNYLLM